MKKLFLFSFLAIVVATVAWAQRDKLLPLVLPLTQKAVGASENQQTAKEGKAATPLAEPSVQQQTVIQTATSNEMSEMLRAFDRILGLSEEQKSEILPYIEKAFERVARARNIPQDAAYLRMAEHTITTQRDKEIVAELTPAQVDKWERFIAGKDAAAGLKVTNERKTPYERGEKKFYPESEYGEFTSLEQIKEVIKEKEATIKAAGFSGDELEQLYFTIYNFN